LKSSWTYLVCRREAWFWRGLLAGMVMLAGMAAPAGTVMFVDIVCRVRVCLGRVFEGECL
jgi:hypothetical protein